VVVRTHGEVQVIDATVGNTPDDADNRMYWLERFTLESATAVFAQSEAMRAFYTRVYSLHPARVVVAPPPMDALLAPFQQQQQQQPEHTTPATTHAPEGSDAECTHAAAALSGIRARCTGCPVVLVAGKLQPVKGTETVAAAAVAAMSDAHAWVAGAMAGRTLTPTAASAARAALSSFHVVFVGDDRLCTLHGRRPMSACVRSAVPRHLQDRVHIVPAVRRTCLPRAIRALAPTAAVVASEFETFNLAAHELAAAHVPLILSDIPAFREFFTDGVNALLFPPGNATALAVALGRAVADEPLMARLRSAPALQYGDPLGAYYQVVGGTLSDADSAQPARGGQAPSMIIPAVIEDLMGDV
jgi:glycosyltransferase involved in cell wall biosynthesis